MSVLLYDERPLVVNPTLAASIGVPEAIVIQQVHYWVLINARAGRNAHDGYFWTYNSYAEWNKEIPFYSRNTIIRAIKSLEKRGLIVSGSYNRSSQDRTKWYRVDYDMLFSLPKMSKCIYSDWENAFTQRELMDVPGLGKPLPETYSESSSESSSERPAKKSSKHEGMVNEVFEAMRSYLGYPDKTEKDPIPNYGQEGQAVKRLLTRGYTVAEIMEYWRGRVDTAGGFVSMIWINQDIGRPAARPKTSRRRPGAIPSQAELDGQARRLGLDL